MFAHITKKLYICNVFERATLHVVRPKNSNPTKVMTYTAQDFANAVAKNKVQFSELHISEYTLRYWFGTWHTACKIYAEDDNEAIFDADHTERTANDKLTYALFKGNKKIKEYPQAEQFKGYNNK